MAFNFTGVYIRVLCALFGIAGGVCAAFVVGVAWPQGPGVDAIERADAIGLIAIIASFILMPLGAAIGWIAAKRLERNSHDGEEKGSS